jgi:hypothetical protein
MTRLRAALRRGRLRGRKAAGTERLSGWSQIARPTQRYKSEMRREMRRGTPELQRQGRKATRLRQGYGAAGAMTGATERLPARIVLPVDHGVSTKYTREQWWEAESLGCRGPEDASRFNASNGDPKIKAAPFFKGDMCLCFRFVRDSLLAPDGLRAICAIQSS